MLRFFVLTKTIGGEAMEQAAVIGHPIAHTMSPFIHGELYKHAGKDYQYQVLDLPDLSEGQNLLRGLDVFNVTIPYKQEVLSYLDEVDDKAERFGAVNTVRVRNGRMKGYTTDGAGFLQAMLQYGEVPHGKVVLLGTGGAARSIAFELLYQGCEVTLLLVCRDTAKRKTEALTAELCQLAAERGLANYVKIQQCTYDELEKAEDTDIRLLINATSVGMYRTEDHGGLRCPVSERIIMSADVVFDAVYNPEETMLIQTARIHRKKTVTGMHMLVYQAAEAHRLWYGMRYEQDFLEQLCRRTVSEMNRSFQESGRHGGKGTFHA